MYRWTGFHYTVLLVIQKDVSDVRELKQAQETFPDMLAIK